MIIILGAGLSGLSTAYHLRDAEYRIFEKEAEVGGLCRSVKKDGFVFDFTGHLLHLRNTYTKNLVKKLLPNLLQEHKRKAWIYSKGVFTKYPFQANLHGLPKEVVKECLMGFIHSTLTTHNSQLTAHNFLAWILNTFGEGIARHFMIPYNEKMWRIPLDQITTDWISWSIPKPNLEEVVNGALGLSNKEFGYNPTFFYPKTGGIQVLPHSFLPHIKKPCLNTEVVKIDSKRKWVTLSNSHEQTYEKLISSLPLPELIDKMVDAPEYIKHLASGLRYVSVLDINLGINKKDNSDRHWVYVPEPEFVFYRIGFPAKFSENVAPLGNSSMYIEVSYLPEKGISEHQAVRKTIDGLKQMGILAENNEIIVKNIINIKYAYVIYDQFRKIKLPVIMKYLEDNNIYSVGRYGAWKYSSMEEGILDGKNIATEVVKVH